MLRSFLKHLKLKMGYEMHLEDDRHKELLCNWMHSACRLALKPFQRRDLQWHMPIVWLLEEGQQLQ